MDVLDRKEMSYLLIGILADIYKNSETTEIELYQHHLLFSWRPGNPGANLREIRESLLTMC